MINDKTTLEARVLSEVRRQWTPSEATLARLRTSLDARLDGPGALVPPEPSVSPISLGGVKALLATAAASAGIAFAAGYWVGQRSNDPSPELPTSAPPRVSDARPSRKPTVAAAPDVREPPPEPPSAAAPAKRAPAAAPPTRAPAPEAEVAAITYKDPLDAEVDLLRRVEHSLRQGNGRLAVALLRELDETVPKGQLLQERAASRIMANCLNAAPGAQASAAEYLEQNSKSPFAARVRALCEMETRSPDGSPASGD